MSREKRRSAVPYSGAYEVLQSVVLQKLQELRRTTPYSSCRLPPLSVRFLASAPLRGLPAETSLRGQVHDVEPRSSSSLKAYYGKVLISLSAPL